MQQWISASDAAEMLGVGPDTLRRWAAAGHVPSFLTPGGRRRYKRADIEAVLRAGQS